MGGEDTNNHFSSYLLYLDIQRFSRLSHDSFCFCYCITIVFVFCFFSVPFRPPFFVWWRDFSFNFISQRFPLFLSLFDDYLGSPFLVYSYSCNSSSVMRVTTGYTLHSHNHHLTFEMRQSRSLKRSWIKRLEWVKKPGFHIWLDWKDVKCPRKLSHLIPASGGFGMSFTSTGLNVLMWCM